MFKCKFSLIFSKRGLFFRPPPQINTSWIFFLDSLREKDNSSPMTLAVKSVSVVTPSSKLKPLTKETSKSFVSNDKFFLFFLLLYNSCACS